MSGKGTGYFSGKSTESTSMANVGDLPEAKGKKLSWKQTAALGGAGIGLLACAGVTVIATQATQTGSIETPTPTPTLPLTKTPESTPTPTPPPPVEGPITGFYFGLQERDGEKTIVGGISGKAIEDDLVAKGQNGYKVPFTADGAHEARMNVLYWGGKPEQIAAYSLDDKTLSEYFKVEVGKDGSIKGQIPGGGAVEKKGNLWFTTAPDGSPLVLNPLVMSRTGQLFGAPVILEKGGKLFLALVDANTGGLVTNPQDAFQTPAAVAAANGFKGPQTVGSVELLPSGLMVVRGPNREFVAEINFSGKAVMFEQWVQTSTPDAELLKQAKATYAKTMGINENSIETVVQIKKGIDGPLAVVADKEGTPLLISSMSPEGVREWKSVVLKTFANEINFGIGNLFSDQYIGNMSGLDQLTIDQFNLAAIGPLSSSQLEPTKGKYEFFNSDGTTNYNSKSETALALAIKNGLMVKGGPLVYGYEDFKWGWAKEYKNSTRDEVIKAMKDHIVTIMSHFKGRGITQWIVANEVLPSKWNPVEWDPYALVVGDDYVYTAFRTARETDPNVTLIYNMDLNETPGSQRFELTLQTLRKLRNEKLTLSNGQVVPLVDAVGMQMHLNGENPPTKQQLLQVFKAYGDTGAKVLITEMDVNMSNVTGSDEERFIKQAQIYRTVLEACLESKVCTQMSFWGVGDKYNWFESQRGQPNADATIFNDDLTPKRAYYEILKVLYARMMDLK